MANNRVELATLPRHIRSIPGKTDGSGLLLDTEVVTFVFEPTTSPAATGLANANLAITSIGTYTDRLADKTIALIFETNTSGVLEGSWFSYLRGVLRANDTWMRISSTVVTSNASDATIDNGTVVRTYVLTVDGNVVESIPIATWAQDASTIIPRQKLPDVAYGETYFYASLTNRNANAGAHTGKPLSSANAVVGAAPQIVWHQNDIAIILDGATESAFVYIGADQGTTAAVTTNDDWLQLGSTVTVSKVNFYLTVVNRTTVLAVNAANNTTYEIRNIGGSDLRDEIVFTGANFALSTAFEVSINGVLLAETIDYEVNSLRDTIIFQAFTFITSGTDLVHISGVSI